ADRRDGLRYGLTVQAGVCVRQSRHATSSGSRDQRSRLALRLGDSGLRGDFLEGTHCAPAMGWHRGNFSWRRTGERMSSGACRAVIFRPPDTLRKSMHEKLCNVAVAVPLRTTFTYRVPERLAAEIAPGSRV